MTGPGASSDRRERAQLVLVAAAVVAVALAPVLFAYLQLGAHPDVEAGSEYDHPEEDAVRVLERSVHEVGANVTGEFNWSEREAAATATRRQLRPRLDRLAGARVEEGVVYRAGYDAATAGEWATAHCPGGPDRQFGPCEAHEGVVVQNRSNETHVLAVALDLTVTTERDTARLTVVVRTVGGV